ncbi:MAG: hypothetical protein WAL59_20860 [Roseiarcus sp.]
MASLLISRRSAIAALAAAVACPVLAHGEESAASGLRFRAIKVDVSGVRESGDVTSAEWIAQDLPEDLRKAFAPFLAPGDSRAPILLARIDLVTLGTGGSGGGPNSTQAVDFIQGADVVIGPGGRQIASYPFFSTVFAYPAEYSASGVTGHTRISNLALSFANFLPGKMGLR